MASYTARCRGEAGVDASTARERKGHAANIAGVAASVRALRKPRGEDRRHNPSWHRCATLGGRGRGLTGSLAA